MSEDTLKLAQNVIKTNTGRPTTARILAAALIDLHERMGRIAEEVQRAPAFARTGRLEIILALTKGKSE